MAYNRRTWLCENGNYATSNVVAFDGAVLTNGKYHDVKFLSISDCHNTIKLYKNEGETIESFVEKLSILQSEIEDFIDDLKYTYKIGEANDDLPF